MGNKPLNFTTKIAARQTTGECITLLAEAGADAVAVQYADKQPVGLSFQLDTPAGSRNFTMPVNVDGVHRTLLKASSSGQFRADGYRVARYETRDHAANVAWRVVRDWLEAQLALIAAEMASLDQVMLPYLSVGDGETLYERFVESAGLRAAIERGP